MERVTGIGGVFLKAKDRKALLAWYGRCLGIQPAADFDGMVFRWAGSQEGTTTWALFPADTEYFGSGASGAMVNYRVEDLDRMLAQLREAGVDVDPRVEESEYGRFGWATDPEGNRIELWQPASGM
jgi:predicted enzyme related to lactoylglutathione lyase